jgi:hypothetical protein
VPLHSKTTSQHVVNNLIVMNMNVGDGSELVSLGVGRSSGSHCPTGFHR